MFLPLAESLGTQRTPYPSAPLFRRPTWSRRSGKPLDVPAHASSRIEIQSCPLTNFRSSVQTRRNTWPVATLIAPHDHLMFLSAAPSLLAKNLLISGRT